MKKFSKFEVAVIKRTAQNVNPMVTKKNKLMAQINELECQVDELQKMIDQYEAAIVSMTGGFSTEDLVRKVVEDTGKVDKNGQSIKITKFVLKYPETIVPIEMDDMVVLNGMEEVNEVNE